MEKFPAWTVNGNLYEKAHALAETQLTHPALQSLDLAYEVIADRCDGKNIQLSDITNVFAQSAAGEQFRMLLDARDMVSTVKDAWFDKSCLAVYACYNNDALTAQWVDIPRLKYSQDVFWSCTTTVDDLFLVMYQRASTLETMKNVNYGDDFLANANPDDGPYDLLLDIQAIGDVLFAHNDGPSEIHFYDMEPVGSYVKNDPDKLTTFKPTDPDARDRVDRFPATNGVTPSVPLEAKDLVPPELPIPATQPSSFNVAIKPFDFWPVAQSAGAQQWSSIANIACEVPLQDTPPAKDILDLATAENEQTTTYNTKLDLDTEVAILLWGKMLPEEEAKKWILPRGGVNRIPPVETIPPPTNPEAPEVAKQIFTDILDLDGVSLENTKKRIQQCVEEFTDGDKGAWVKILAKSITQPAEFTKCVFGDLCDEIGDPSWRGMFRIKVCRELRKWSWLISNQSIKSSEEVIDEMLNVCTTLKESGALLEHNKTKDHLEDKLMRIKFWNKFAFGVSVIFKWPRDAADPAVAKLKAREQRAYLEKTHLSLTDDLTFVEERNRYLVIQGKGARKWLDANDELTKRNQAQLEKNARVADVIYKQWVAANKNVVAEQLQLNSTAGIIAQVQEFVVQNIEMRKTANQYTDSINTRRATTLRLYQASPD